jgi:streptogramin lyase
MRVQRFAPDGRLIGSFGSPGLGDGQFAGGMAIAVGPAGSPVAGDVWVADPGQEWIHRFTAGGRWIAGWPIPEALSRDQVLARGFQIAVSPSGTLLLNGIGDFVGILSAEGELLGTFGETGSEDGQIARASGVTVGPEGTIYVLDTMSDQIHVFDPDGAFLRRWSLYDDGVTDSNPGTVVAAPDGSIVVGFWDQSFLLRFDPLGNRLETLTLSAMDETVSPKTRSLTIAPDGSILSVDLKFVGQTPEQTYGAIFRRFEADGTLTAEWGGLSDHTMDWLGDVAFTADGSLFAYERRYRTIHAFDSTGRHVDRLTFPTDLPGRAGASSIAGGPDGSLYVASSGQKVIHRIGPDYQFKDPVLTFPLSGAPNGQLRQAEVAPDGALYVLLWAPDTRIARFEPGESEPTWIVPNPRHGIRASGLAVSDAPHVTLGDYGSGRQRVVQIARDGALLRRWGMRGNQPGRFGTLADLVLGPDESVYTLDRKSGRIQHFSKEGRFLDTWFAHGLVQDDTRLPFAGFDLHDGRLAVAHRDDERILVYGAGEAPTWRVESFRNRWLAGWADAVAEHEALDLTWEAPAPGSPDADADGRSIRASRAIAFEPGRHRLAFASSGGARVWVGDRLVADRWDSDSFDLDTVVEIESGGIHLVRVEHANGPGEGHLRFAIAPESVQTMTPTVAPTGLPTPQPTRTPWPTRTPSPDSITVYLPIAYRAGEPLGPPAKARPHMSIPGIDVEHYDVALTIRSLGDSDIEARVDVTIRALETLHYIDLDVEPVAIHVRSVRAGGEDLAYAIVPGTPNAYGLTGSALRTTLPAPLAVGESITMTIQYTIDQDSFYDSYGFTYSSDYYGIDVLATRSWNYYTRHWLPSHDNPIDPASLSVHLRVPHETVAASNGRLEGGDFIRGEGLDEEGLRVFRWHQERPIPPHTMHVLVGPLDVREERICFNTDRINRDLVDCAEAQHELPYVYYHSKDLIDLDQFNVTLEESKRALVYFSSVFGLFPFDKYGVSTIPHPFSMEHASIVTLTFPDAAVHEVLHHWWGDSVMFEHWGELWISEGMVSFLQNHYALEVAGVGATQSLSGGGQLVHPPSADPRDVSPFTPYDKGAGAVTALRERVAELAGLPVGDPSETELFLGLLADLYRTFELKHLNSESLIVYLHEGLRDVLADHGVNASAEDVRVAIDSWALQWFELSTSSRIILELNGDGGVVRKGGLTDDGWLPSVRDTGPVAAPLALYGNACPGEDGSVPDPEMAVAGKLAVIESGRCAAFDMVANAERHGAVGVIVDSSSSFIRTMTCSAPSDCPAAPEIPAFLFYSAAPELDLRARLEAGEAIMARLTTVDDAVREPWPEAGGGGWGEMRLR